MLRRRRPKGTNAFTVKGSEPIATAKTAPSVNTPIRIYDSPYEQWIATEPADDQSPEWDAWMNRWPG